MRHIISLIILLLFILSTICSVEAQQDAQQLPRGTRNYGYVINSTGDTVYGYTMNLNLWSNQMVAVFFKADDAVDRGTKYRAKNLRGYKTGPREYESLNHAGRYSPYRQNFFLKCADGAIDLFTWFYNTDINQFEGEEALLTEASDSFLIKEEELWEQHFGRTEEGTIVDFSSVGFKSRFHKKMSRLVEDHEKLAEKILSRQVGYRYEDLEEIIREYNDWKTR